MLDNSLEHLRFTALSACIAYESGFGKGINLKNNQSSENYFNPYVKDSFDYFCFDIGFNEGKERNKPSEPVLLIKLVEENSSLREKVKELEDLYQNELWSDRRN
jgi:hypothetical protein